MSGNYMDQALAQITIFEGSVSWMYVDTVGKVTVGVGRMLPDVVAAQALPFQAAGQAATAEQIVAEFQRVSCMKKGEVAGFYKTQTCLQLGAAEINELLKEVLTGFEAKLRAKWPNYDQFPDEAKLALLDMAYNLGPDGLLKGYPSLVRAVGAGNWTEAAADCERRGPSLERNTWTKKMFLSAAARPVSAPVSGAAQAGLQP